MPKVLVFAYNAFSDTNANGKTIKSLLSALSANEVAQFYCGTENPDWSVTGNYFQVTDIMMVKSYYRKMQYIRQNSSDISSSNNILTSQYSKLRKHNYNFCLRLIRDLLWKCSYGWRFSFKKWVDDFKPELIFYMVGDSVFMDSLVLSIAKRYQIPIVLYNCEAYRIIDLKQRKGVERFYYRRVENSYKKLLLYNSLHVIYNSQYLRRGYSSFYRGLHKSHVFYTPSVFENTSYQPNYGKLNFIYFGNMGVGRVDSLISFANALRIVNDTFVLEIYGSVPQTELHKFNTVDNVKLMGVVSAKELRDIKERADVLVHVESFDSAIVPKLRFAFSTKIAQYLCAGRCMISYAPKNMASSEYLIESKSVLFAYSFSELLKVINNINENRELLKQYADKSFIQAKENHDENIVSKQLYALFNELIS